MKVCLGEKMLNYTLNFDNEMSKQWCIDKGGLMWGGSVTGPVFSSLEQVTPLFPWLFRCDEACPSCSEHSRGTRKELELSSNYLTLVRRN